MLIVSAWSETFEAFGSRRLLLFSNKNKNDSKSENLRTDGKICKVSRKMSTSVFAIMMGISCKCSIKNWIHFFEKHKLNTNFLNQIWICFLLFPFKLVISLQSNVSKDSSISSETKAATKIITTHRYLSSCLALNLNLAKTSRPGIDFSRPHLLSRLSDFSVGCKRLDDWN